MAVPLLTVTSPYKTGQVVQDAQWLLSHNRYGKFYSGPIDGIFAPTTSAASYRAKYWLGYPTEGIDHRYGPTLRSFLLIDGHEGSSALPAAYLTRRNSRLEAKRIAELPRSKALLEARKWLNYREGPDNQTIFGAWYGADHNPWCAMFCSYCVTQVGGHLRESFCPAIYTKACQSLDGLFVTADPEPGDLALFDWGRDRTIDHVEFFSSWVGNQRQAFKTVAGNTVAEGSAGDQANGGGVFGRTRYTQAARIVFVRYN